MFCQKCGYQMNEGENVCPSCGALAYGKKFCQHCGQAVDNDCVVCPKCGKQIDVLKTGQPQPQQVVINNENINTNTHTNTSTHTNRDGAKNKWVAFLLCLCFGYFGVHKFYEGKILMGIIYACTFGLFGIGWIVDTIALLLKPNPYYV